MRAEIKKAKAPPPARGGRPPIYPFGAMKVGQQTDLQVPRKTLPERFAATVRSAASSYRQRNELACSFVIRYCDETGAPLIGDNGQRVVRVWCVKPLARGERPR